MAKRATAGVLLAAILAWAEMALAPMLMMHAGHMRPGHEMAADMPGEQAAHHHGEPGGRHPCCPSLNKAQSENVIEFATGDYGCSDPHSCCFRQGPQSVPAPARDLQRDDQRLAGALVRAALGQVTRPVPAGRTGHDGALALSSPPDVFGMTLRV